MPSTATLPGETAAKRGVSPIEKAVREHERLSRELASTNLMPCPTESLLRQIAQIVRRVETEQDRGNDAALAKALLDAAAFTRPTSQIGVAFMAVLSSHFVNETSDFIDFPETLRGDCDAFRVHLNERTHARDAISAELVKALCDAVEDRDLQEVRDYVCPYHCSDAKRRAA